MYLYLYKFIKIRYNILKHCHGNYMEMNKFKYMLESGSRDWVPKFCNCRIFGLILSLIFHGRTQYIEIVTLNLYLLIEIMH